MLNKPNHNDRPRLLELFGPSAFLVIIILLLATLAVGNSFPAEQPDAAAILDAYVEATGGADYRCRPGACRAQQAPDRPCDGDDEGSDQVRVHSGSVSYRGY